MCGAHITQSARFLLNGRFSFLPFLRVSSLAPFPSHLFVKRCYQKLLGDTAYLRPTLLSLKGGLWSLENLGNLGSLGYLGYLRSLRLPPFTPPSPKLGEGARRRQRDAFVRVVILKVKTHRRERILGAQENLPRSLLDANEGEIYHSATPKTPLICVF